MESSPSEVSPPEITLMKKSPTTVENDNNDVTNGKNEQRNAEIWSTRLQRELLAIVTDNASESSKKEKPGILPSFCSLKDHALDIERGNCTVTCLLTLPMPPAPEDVAAATDKVKAVTEESVPKKEDGDDSSDTGETEADTASDPIITITLDVSMKKKADGFVDPAAMSYPFLKPIAILTSGCERFPQGSTIKDGDNIGIEMDWTPSLHLTDAILNVSLQLKECFSQGESVHSSPKESLASMEASNTDVVGDVMNRAKNLGSSFGLSLRNITSTAADTAANASSRLSLRKKVRKPKKLKPKANHSEVRIGDEINLLEAPWVDCMGVYSCKVIRQPTFVKEAIELAAPEGRKTNDNESSEVANAGFAGAGALFRSFATSARGVLEESFLMITESHIIEIRSNKLNLSTGTVTFAIPIEMMAKLKFRRQESVSLFFKPAPDDPLIYMCPDSADCVHQIQAALKRHGVKGKHTNAATHRAINQALHFVQEIQTKELALKHDPTIDRVNEIMDLYRQAAERFEAAGDVRHEEVVTHMRKFLALPLTISVLDGSYKKPAEDASSSKSESRKEDEKFEENMDNLLAEAEADLANMKTNKPGNELDDLFNDDFGDVDGGSADDAIADFENMLKEADNELAELMSS